MNSSKTRARLVVDPDLIFAQALESAAKAEGLSLFVAKDGKSGQLLLSDSLLVFSAIFVNLKLPEGGDALSVIRFAHRYHPATPLYFLLEGEKETFSRQELMSMGVQDYVRKPVSCSDLITYPKPLDLQLKPELSVGVAEMETETFDLEVGAEDLAFIAILAENFLSGSTSFFDIYVRLSSSRYVKILKAGDSFSEDRTASFIKKGVTHFYLRKETQEIYLNYCQKLAASMIKSNKVNTKIQLIHTLNHGREVMNYLEKQGIDPNSLQYATQFVGNLKELMVRTRPKDNPYFDEFLADIAGFEHAVGVTLVASILGQVLGIASNTLQLIGMAGMFHDIGLLQLPPELRSEDESTMSQDQKRLYYTHPLLGAEVLKSFKEVEPTAIQAIMQHHERRNRQGFPDLLGPDTINRVSEIIGISDQLIRFLQLAKNSKIDPVAEVLVNITSGFSYQVGEAFKTIFRAKK